MPPHLAQQGTPGLTSAAQNNSDVSLDPNDFPALGSGNTPGSATNANAPSSANLHSSYATQAGTGVPPTSATNASGAQGTGNGPTSRDFGPDDFPALGGQAQQQGTPQTQEATAVAQQHPPGINGFQQNDQSQAAAQQHRQNLLGSMTAGGLGTQQQGMLGQQPRGLHTGFEPEKRVCQAARLVTLAHSFYIELCQTKPELEFGEYTKRAGISS